MEESVWMVIGSILAIFSIFLIGTAIVSNTRLLREADVSNSVKQLTEHCNLMCGMTPGTIISTDVILPAESILTLNDTRICIIYNERNTCDFCRCPISEYMLNLTGSSVFFDSNTFRCTFTRGGVLDVECKG